MHNGTNKMHFYCMNQKLSLKERAFVVGNSNDYLTAKVDFTDDWDGHAKVLFFHNAEHTYPFLLNGDNEIVKGQHLNLTSGYWEVYCYGYDGSVTDPTVLPTSVPRISTNVIELYVEVSGGTDGTQIVIEPASIGEQILSAAQGAVNTANSVREDADNGVFDGFAPTVRVLDVGDSHLVTITDKDGEHKFLVKNGERGAQGSPGPQGEPGETPYIRVREIPGGHEVQITVNEDDKYFDVMDGEKGGDGFSPAVTTTPISGGTQVRITDASGTHSFNVMNGEDNEGYYVMTANASGYISNLDEDTFREYFPKVRIIKHNEGMGNLIYDLCNYDMDCWYEFSCYYEIQTDGETPDYLYRRILSHAYLHPGVTDAQVTFSDFDLDDKQDKLTAGENITIENGVISATGGDGIDVFDASPDQIVKIKSVGADGKPTAWEATDLKDCPVGHADMIFDGNITTSGPFNKATGIAGLQDVVMDDVYKVTLDGVLYDDDLDAYFEEGWGLVIGGIDEGEIQEKIGRGGYPFAVCCDSGEIYIAEDYAVHGTHRFRIEYGDSDTLTLEQFINEHHDDAKQDTLTAGENITIENGVISATGGGGGEKQLLASVTTSELTPLIELAWEKPKNELFVIFRQTTRKKSYFEDSSGEKTSSYLMAQINGRTDKNLWFTTSVATSGDNVSNVANIFASGPFLSVFGSGVTESGNGYSTTQALYAPRIFNSDIGGINSIKLFPSSNGAQFSVGFRIEIWG